MGMADLDHCTYSRYFEAPWGIEGCASAPFEYGMANGVSRLEVATMDLGRQGRCRDGMS